MYAGQPCRCQRQNVMHAKHVGQDGIGPECTQKAVGSDERCYTGARRIQRVHSVAYDLLECRLQGTMSCVEDENALCHLILPMAEEAERHHLGPTRLITRNDMQEMRTHICHLARRSVMEMPSKSA
jgi:hypothetical protein